MLKPFILAPRYRLDDDDIWLRGIDPSRNYWVYVNGDEEFTVTLPGLMVTDISDWKETMRLFRSLQPQEQMEIERAASTLIIYCVSENCYAIAHEVFGAPVWHLFDQETMESLLMSAHPDWICSTQDVDLGRASIIKAFEQPACA